MWFGVLEVICCSFWSPVLVGKLLHPVRKRTKYYVRRGFCSYKRSPSSKERIFEMILGDFFI